jgi:hypothetical protein
LRRESIPTYELGFPGTASARAKWSSDQSINQSIELLLVVSYMFLINSPNN